MKRDRVKRLAVALWDWDRRELQTGGTVPAFHSYADGDGEPMPFSKQGVRFQRYWLKVARELLRAIR